MTVTGFLVTLIVTGVIIAFIAGIMDAIDRWKNR